MPITLPGSQHSHTSPKSEPAAWGSSRSRNEHAQKRSSRRQRQRSGVIAEHWPRRTTLSWHVATHSSALAGPELVASRRTSDHTPHQPAPTQCEGRKHVRAAIATYVGGGRHLIARCALRESPDPHAPVLNSCLIGPKLMPYCLDPCRARLRGVEGDATIFPLDSIAGRILS